MQTPLITIVIPSYNREAYIGETLESVLYQSYPNWECIVVDDGSDDSSINIIEKYCKMDHRFRLYNREHQPKGAPACRNIGIEKSSGDYIMFLDSDDLLTRNCLAYRIEYTHTYPDYDCWTFPSIRFSDKTNQNLDKFYYNTCNDHLFFAMLIRIQWPINATLTKRTILKKYNIRFDESLHRWQDWQFHLDFLIKGIKFKRNNSIEYDVRIRQHNNDQDKISLRKKSTDNDVNSLLRLMIYLHENLHPDNYLMQRAMLLRWFTCIEHLIYFHRGDRVKEFLFIMNRKGVFIPMPYRLLFMLPSYFYSKYIPSLFFNRALFIINQYFKKRVLKIAGRENWC